MKHFFTLAILFFSANLFAQNVGIGTTTPSTALTVKTNGIGISQESVDSTVKVGFYTATGNAYIQTHTNTDLKFATNNGSTAMVLQKATGNFGIGNANPSEKLDVTGNINLTGQLKTNGNAGNANQVLMKDASNNPIWASIGDYKNMAVFNCSSSAASTAGANNLTYNWIVPTGVTNVLIEGWSGGGGGGNLSGGGGGGYFTFIFPVTASNTITIIVGAGGNNGTTSTNGIQGGITSIAYGGGSASINGGNGGFSGDATLNGTTTTTAASGGSLSTAGITNVDAYYGGYGNPSVIKFEQVSATEFARVITNGNGGDAPLWPGSGGKGGYSLTSTTYNLKSYASITGVFVGGGGGSDYSGGGRGLGGRVIIHY